VTGTACSGLSFAMYGRESLHEHLRLLSCIEILGHPELYDIHSDTFYAPFQSDRRIVLSDYSVFVADTVCYGSYSDMLTVLSLSSVIQKPIQMRWPIVVHPGEASPPMTQWRHDEAVALRQSYLLTFCGLLLAQHLKLEMCYSLTTLFHL